MSYPITSKTQPMLYPRPFKLKKLLKIPMPKGVSESKKTISIIILKLSKYHWHIPFTHHDRIMGKKKET